MRSPLKLEVKPLLLITPQSQS
uniref:Uncharacterized protein n=1 Tax=Anguilla anguilla TaxID=7936 RepID=A0A0E9VFV5_ANGAN